MSLKAIVVLVVQKSSYKDQRPNLHYGNHLLFLADCRINCCTQGGCIHLVKYSSLLVYLKIRNIANYTPEITCFFLVI